MASDIARSLATQYGMVSSLGEVAYDRQQSPFLNGGSRPGWLEAHRELLDSGARALLQKETLSIAELQDLVSRAARKGVAAIETETPVVAA